MDRSDEALNGLAKIFDTTAASAAGIVLIIALVVILISIAVLIVEIVIINKLVKKVQMACGEPVNSIGQALLICLIPFYNWYWVYTRSKKLYESGMQRGIMISDNAILYLVLTILITPIISWDYYLDAKKVTYSPAE